MRPRTLVTTRALLTAPAALTATEARTVFSLPRGIAALHSENP